MKFSSSIQSSLEKVTLRVPAFSSLGLFSTWIYNKAMGYTDKHKINTDKCVGCGICAKNCPAQNIKLTEGKAAAGSQCTMCYRCVNNCPKQAITLLGKEVVRQATI